MSGARRGRQLIRQSRIKKDIDPSQSSEDIEFEPSYSQRDRRFEDFEFNSSFQQTILTFLSYELNLICTITFSDLIYAFLLLRLIPLLNAPLTPHVEIETARITSQSPPLHSSSTFCQNTSKSHIIIIQFPPESTCYRGI